MKSFNECILDLSYPIHFNDHITRFTAFEGCEQSENWPLKLNIPLYSYWTPLWSVTVTWKTRYLVTIQWAVSQLLNDCAMRLILKPQLYQTATSWGKVKISQGEAIETRDSPSALWLFHQSVGNIIIITSLSQIHPDSSYMLLMQMKIFWDHFHVYKLTLCSSSCPNKYRKYQITKVLPVIMRRRFHVGTLITDFQEQHTFISMFFGLCCSLL